MNSLAITGATASWLLGKAGLLDSLHHILLSPANEAEPLHHGEFVEGSVRFSATQDGSVVALWNVDYISGSGDDAWGLIDLTEATGLAGHQEISREVLERSIYIISQRSQGLLIDGAYIHRSWPNGTHTCLAGRGVEARQESIGYVERDISADASLIHTIAISGPEKNLAKLSGQTKELERRIDKQVLAARMLYEPSRKRNALPSSAYPRFREAVAGYFRGEGQGSEFSEVSVPASVRQVPPAEMVKTSAWGYTDWVRADSALSASQRRLLNSDALLRHPIRITGPAGSGKTLLTQLLTIRRLQLAAGAQGPARILYLVHNEKMVEMVKHRFSVLLGDHTAILSDERFIDVRTLSEYARDSMGLDFSQVVDSDAHAAKEFQVQVLETAISEVFASQPRDVQSSRLFMQVNQNEALKPLFRRMLMAEISIAIKGHGLEADSRRYIQSERPLSRLHGVLSQTERQVVFDIFRSYHETMFDAYGVLDSDDVALSLLGRLRTPIWQLKRKEFGYHHVFIDECQLFNENERRLFPYLSNGESSYVPLVIALDEAQELYGQTNAGLATLGIENLASENLTTLHRSSAEIVRLAFFVIQRSTDLFGPDFPDFTSLVGRSIQEKSAVADLPTVEQIPDEQENYSRFILKKIRALRKANLRRIAIVCMSEQFWSPLLSEFRQSDLPLHVLEQRGERLEMTGPIVVMSRPAHIGGQEFDVVILAGAEEGLLPPRVLDNEALASAVEQQTLRELYLAITRAKQRVIVILSRGAALSPVLADAQKVGLLRPER